MRSSRMVDLSQSDRRSRMRACQKSPDSLRLLWSACPFPPLFLSPWCSGFTHRQNFRMLRVRPPCWRCDLPMAGRSESGKRRWGRRVKGFADDVCTATPRPRTPASTSTPTPIVHAAAGRTAGPAWLWLSSRRCALRAGRRTVLEFILDDAASEVRVRVYREGLWF